jgi:hypothetical protein
MTARQTRGLSERAASPVATAAAAGVLGSVTAEGHRASAAFKSRGEGAAAAADPTCPRDRRDQRALPAAAAGAACGARALRTGPSRPRRRCIRVVRARDCGGRPPATAGARVRGDFRSRGPRAARFSPRGGGRRPIRPSAPAGPGRLPLWGA